MCNRRQETLRCSRWPVCWIVPARHFFVLLVALVITGLLPARLHAKESPSRPAITGISHITLYADDIAKSERFYTQVIGWKQMSTAGGRSDVRFYANHQQYVELVSPPRTDLIDRLEGFGFVTADAEGLRRFLGAHGITVPTTVTTEPDGSHSFFVHDPAGNKVEFTQLSSHPVPAPPELARRLSTHIMHLGFVAWDRDALDGFYKNLLGFSLYWQGSAKPGNPDWVMMQVPNGTDWIEYMLYLPASPSRGQLASANHFSPGVVSIDVLYKRLLAQGWKPSGEEKPPLLALDGKWQLDLFDPDGTRVEFMEFKPVGKVCCSDFTGRTPGPYLTW